jgi:hypothetical protein
MVTRGDLFNRLDARVYQHLSRCVPTEGAPPTFDPSLAAAPSSSHSTAAVLSRSLDYELYKKVSERGAARGLASASSVVSLRVLAGLSGLGIAQRAVRLTAGRVGSCGVWLAACGFLRAVRVLTAVGARAASSAPCERAADPEAGGTQAAAGHDAARVTALAFMLIWRSDIGSVIVSAVAQK